MSDEADRAAILARRRRFVAVALAGLGGCTPEPATQVPSTEPPPAPAAPSSVTTQVADAPADSDGDGILDVDDHCPQIPGIPLRDSMGCPPRPCLNMVSQNEIVILAQVHFDKLSPALPVRAVPVLDEVAATLMGHPELDLDVAGHCEKPERPPIAKRRAEAVRDALVKRGVDKARLRVAETSECEAPDPKDAAASEAARRVDFPNVRERKTP